MVTEGAAPLVAARFMPLAWVSVMYGAVKPLTAFTGLAAEISCNTKSVAVKLRLTPLQVVQVGELVVPTASKDAVVPGGGKISRKFAPI
jgi:hypothetical protein